MKSFLRGNSGITLVETMVVVIVIAVVAIPLAQFVSTSLRDVTRSNLNLQSQDDLRRAFIFLERDVMELNEVTLSSSTLIEFRMDSTRSPAYNPQGDFDGDGILNLQDTDDDSDVTAIYAGTSTWRGGYDHKDDDDDNDVQVDVACRYELTGKTLTRDFNYNGAGWNLNRDVVAQNVSTFQFTYLGSKTQDLGRLIDLGADGVNGTGDAGENDGVITAREIDWVLPPTGGGNRSGSIDTVDERRYINFIGIVIAQDRNQDGREDFRLETQLAPPILPVKRAL
ncbi:MAG: hypothetical protein HY548_02450 [Elusimicrobia bacterium]|nr:hypothetical protein [Elusimicrobiota bacterium]